MINKPTRLLDWNVDTATNESDPAVYRTDGFLNGKSLNAKFLNWIVKADSLWMDYLNGFDCTYYVSIAGTDSAATTGTSGDPFLTIDYAISRVSKWGRATIRLKAGGAIESIINRIPVYGNITIIDDTTPLGFTVAFSDDGATKKCGGFDLYGDSTITCVADITISGYLALAAKAFTANKDNIFYAADNTIRKEIVINHVYSDTAANIGASAGDKFYVVNNTIGRTQLRLKGYYDFLTNTNVFLMLNLWAGDTLVLPNIAPNDTIYVCENVLTFAAGTHNHTEGYTNSKTILATL